MTLLREGHKETTEKRCNTAILVSVRLLQLSRVTVLTLSECGRETLPEYRFKEVLKDAGLKESDYLHKSDFGLDR